jgi:phytoene synthase
MEDLFRGLAPKRLILAGRQRRQLGDRVPPPGLKAEIDAADALALRLRRFDRDRFLATLFAPADRRPDLWALLAFNLEIARVRETVSQPILGQIRLQWWREVLDEAYAGGPVRRHEVATPLAQAIRRWRIDRADLDRMIDGRERDLDDRPAADLAELVEYAAATSGSLNQAMLAVLEAATPAALAAARETGIAWALTGLIRAEPFRVAAGRPFLPAPVADVAAAARAHLAASRQYRGQTQRPALPALLPAVLAGAYLRRLERFRFDPASVAAPDGLSAIRLVWGWVLGRY